MKDIVLPVRMGYKNPNIKDASGRTIVDIPHWMLSEHSEERFEQWEHDMETIVKALNRDLEK